MRERDTLIIGLDAASQYGKFGWAVGRPTSSGCAIDKTGILGSETEAAEGIEGLAKWLRTRSHVLVAVDAPLGWPAVMGRTLATHAAGRPLDSTKDELFHRRTDDAIRDRFKKRPLEVGADKIARASHQALTVLKELRLRSGQEIPLAWNPRFSGAAAIEVYPAATLIARGLPAGGYKDKKLGFSARVALAERLKGQMSGVNAVRALESEHKFDACLCVLAAADFLAGDCVQPQPDALPIAKKEGWIWVAKTQAEVVADTRDSVPTVTEGS